MQFSLLFSRPTHNVYSDVYIYAQKCYMDGWNEWLMFVLWLRTFLFFHLFYLSVCAFAHITIIIIFTVRNVCNSLSLDEDDVLFVTVINRSDSSMHVIMQNFHCEQEMILCARKIIKFTIVFCHAYCNMTSMRIMIALYSLHWMHKFYGLC